MSENWSKTIGIGKINAFFLQIAKIVILGKSIFRKFRAVEFFFRKDFFVVKISTTKKSFQKINPTPLIFQKMAFREIMIFADAHFGQVHRSKIAIWQYPDFRKIHFSKI